MRRHMPRESDGRTHITLTNETRKRIDRMMKEQP